MPDYSSKVKPPSDVMTTEICLLKKGKWCCLDRYNVNSCLTQKNKSVLKHCGRMRVVDSSNILNN